MSGIVEVRDRDEQGFLSVELSDVLEILEPHARELIWAVLDLEARSHPNKFKGDLADVEKTIKESPKGLVLTWPELISFAETLIEVLETVIVGCQDRNSIPKLVARDELFDQCEIGIEAFDSSVWRIHAKDEALLVRIRARFRDVS